jgi:phosphodiesterase/alkaline phosphatase D-like protein
VTPRSLRLLALTWSGAALAAFAALALTAGVPQGPEGALISGTLQLRVQVALLALAAAGLVLALRHRVLGGALMVVAAGGIGVFAAFEYRPAAAVFPFLALFLPGAYLIGSELVSRRSPWIALAAAFLAAVLVVCGVAADQVYAYAFGPTHPESAVQLPDGPVRWIWSGAPSPTAASVVARLDEPDAPVRLVVGTAADLSDAAVRAAPIARTDQGVVRFDVGGLAPGRTYHYALEIGGRLDRTRAGRLRTVPEGPASFRVAFGACARVGSNGRVFDAIRATRPDLYLIAGDMYYGDISSDDPDLFREELDEALTRPAQQALYLGTRTVYTWDDHDYGPNDAGADSPTRRAAQQVFREYVPHDAMPGGADEGTINEAFTMGRLRFLKLDLRSGRDPASAPDGPGKSMLGDAQRAWLERELARAAEAHQVVVLVSSVPWIAAPSPGGDDWSGYADERARIARAVAAHGVPAVMIAGDAHMVALDDGSHSDYSGTGRAGFPVVHGAALDRHGSAKGGPYSEGAHAGSGQFGTMTVRDDGARVRITLTGRNWRGEALVSGTYTFRP